MDARILSHHIPDQDLQEPLCKHCLGERASVSLSEEANVVRPWMDDGRWTVSGLLRFPPTPLRMKDTYRPANSAIPDRRPPQTPFGQSACQQPAVPEPRKYSRPDLGRSRTRRSPPRRPRVPAYCRCPRSPARSSWRPRTGCHHGATPVPQPAAARCRNQASSNTPHLKSPTVPGSSAG